MSNFSGMRWCNISNHKWILPFEHKIARTGGEEIWGLTSGHRSQDGFVELAVSAFEPSAVVNLQQRFGEQAVALAVQRFLSVLTPRDEDDAGCDRGAAGRSIFILNLLVDLAVLSQRP